MSIAMEGKDFSSMKSQDEFIEMMKKYTNMKFYCLYDEKCGERIIHDYPWELGVKRLGLGSAYSGREVYVLQDGTFLFMPWSLFMTNDGGEYEYLKRRCTESNDFLIHSITNDYGYDYCSIVVMYDFASLNDKRIKMHHLYLYDGLARLSDPFSKEVFSK